MNTSQDTPGFDATREALVFYCPTTPDAATKFLTTLQPRDFESLVTAARSGRNQEQTRALVLVAVAEIAACQAMQIAALAGMGVGRLAAEHSVAGRPAEHVNQACELASKALDAAFEARVATKEALAAQDAAELAAAVAAEAVAPPVASAPPAAPPASSPAAPVEDSAPPAARQQALPPEPVAEPLVSAAADEPVAPPAAPQAEPLVSTVADEPVAPPATVPTSAPPKPKRPSLSG